MGIIERIQQELQQQRERRQREAEARAAAQLNDTLAELKSNLKLSEKNFGRQSEKEMREHNKYVNLARREMQENRLESAKGYAQAAIAHKNNSTQYVRMMTFLTNVQTGLLNIGDINIAREANNIARGLLKGMPLNKVAAIMDNFEKLMDRNNLAVAIVDNGLDRVANGAVRNEIDNFANVEKEAANKRARNNGERLAGEQENNVEGAVANGQNRNVDFQGKINATADRINQAMQALQNRQMGKTINK